MRLVTFSPSAKKATCVFAATFAKKTRSMSQSVSVSEEKDEKDYQKAIWNAVTKIA